VIAVAKKIEDFKYDPTIDSFKGWLLYLTRKRIALHYRKRDRERARAGGQEPIPLDAELEAIPDPAGVDIEAIWNDEWETSIADAALARIKEQVNPKQFQIFNFYVLKQWPVKEVAKTLGVSVAQIYIAKHRISGLVRKEVQRLQNGLI
jgi:RNA polymerase sigma-70 factor (ECF subfamily)